MNVKYKINSTILSILLMSSFIVESASLSRYEFTERLSNCNLMNLNISSGENNLGSSILGTNSAGSMASFQACFPPTAPVMNSLSMSAITNINSCDNQLIPLPSQCLYNLSPASSGNSIAVANLNPENTGFSIFTCDNSGNWNLIQEFCTMRNEPICPPAIVQWSDSGRTCEAKITKMISGETKQFSNKVARYNGSATLSCSNGNISVGTKSCDFGCNGLIGSEVSWVNNGNLCTAILQAGQTDESFYAEAKNGGVQYIDDLGDTTNFTYGQAEFSCKNGTPTPTVSTCFNLQPSSTPNIITCIPEDVKIMDSNGVERDLYTHYKCDWD